MRDVGYLRLLPTLLLVGSAAGTLLLGCELIAGIDDLTLTGNDGTFEAGSGPDSDGSAPQNDGGDNGSILPSCRGSASARSCGSDGVFDCCASPLVDGGTFRRSYDAVPGGGYEDPSNPATVSDFRLDRYEVTVGRVRPFVAEYPATLPAQGAGANPHDPTDRGWDESWRVTYAIPASRAALISALRCATSTTWTDKPGENETAPITCVTWFIAYAFCVWDGGRLPTEAEWNYAAAGGSEQRVFPWSSPPESNTVDNTYANFNTSLPDRVGSRSPVGDGRWGHADLAGNVWEWVRDWSGAYPKPCSDCANLAEPDATLLGRAARGGSYTEPYASNLRTSFRSFMTAPADARPTFGARCARNP